MILDLFKSKSEPAPNSPFPRCEHRSPAGRQCSQPICSTSPQFCFTHKPKPEELLTAELTEAAGSLSTPEEIHNFLTKVTLLRVQGRLTPKEACSYAYLCQILQRGQREIAFHQKLKEDRAQRAAEKAEEDEVMSWSIPRPNYDDEPTNAPAKETSLVGAELASPESDRRARPSVSTAPAETTNTSVEVSTPASTSSSKSPSAATDTSVEVLPPAKTVSVPSSPPAPEKKPTRSKPTTKSSTNLPMSPEFYNHFYPIDLTLPPGLQDPSKNIPPPDGAECRRLAARRGLLFTRRRPNLRGTLR